MKLSSEQLGRLKLAQLQRFKPPKLIDILSSAWKKYLAIVALTAGSAAIFWWGGWPLIATFFLGCLFGIVTRDHQTLKIHLRFWPVSVEVTDWDRVAKLISENEPAAS